ncbi:MAG: hypothetical protein A3E87_06005 [Gammaproteobacteria bacterium RIFCSPHIGHO2_12_FULL_35_23]|nr:MAG: hypothetical protein A3E87_06005 [Gammaproteobacteria bacterium RIFCSPHIGHO2_12_FULL_35_23]
MPSFFRRYPFVSGVLANIALTESMCLTSGPSDPTTQHLAIITLAMLLSLRGLVDNYVNQNDTAYLQFAMGLMMMTVFRLTTGCNTFFGEEPCQLRFKKLELRY